MEATGFYTSTWPKGLGADSEYESPGAVQVSKAF